MICGKGIEVERQNKKLVTNTFIYAIGSLGSKIISFLVIPLYSYYIDPVDMGFYDVVLSTISLLQPIIIFQLTDGLLRWLLLSNNDNEKKRIIASCRHIVLITLSITCAVYLLFTRFVNVEHATIILLFLVLDCLFPLIQQGARGFQKNKLYALCGVLYTVIMVGVNCIGLLLLRTGISILYISQIIAGLICSAIFLVKIPTLRKGIVSQPDKNVLNDLLKYSIPLIPNTICWWIVNSSDRYIILYFLGNSSNGIYAMSNKFPTILSTLTSIFYRAWQESAIQEYNSDNRDSFFSNIFNKYSMLLFSASLCLVPATKLFIEHFMAVTYADAWLYSGFLYMGVIFNSLSSFLGIGYQITKETTKSLYTTLVAAALNFFINISMIKFVGLYAAAISTYLAYVGLFIIRLYHTRRYYTLSINWKMFSGLAIANLVFVIILNLTNDLIAVCIFVCAVVFFLKENKYLYQRYLEKILKKIKR